jgi:hypothetical protein
VHAELLFAATDLLPQTAATVQGFVGRCEFVHLSGQSTGMGATILSAHSYTRMCAGTPLEQLETKRQTQSAL